MNKEFRVIKLEEKTLLFDGEVDDKEICNVK